VAAGVKTFNAVLRNLVYKFICWVDDSEHEIIMFVSNIEEEEEEEEEEDDNISQIRMTAGM